MKPSPWLQQTARTLSGGRKAGAVQVATANPHASPPERARVRAVGGTWSPCPTKPDPRSAFTLVELLVVIAIVGDSRQPAVPALTGAKGTRARGSMRFQSPSVWSSGPMLLGRPRRRHVPLSGGHHESRGPLLVWLAGTRRRGRTRFRSELRRPLAVCGRPGNESLPPCGPVAASSRRPRVRRGRYGYNLTLSEPLDRPYLRITEVLRPSEILSFADATQINDFQPPASPDDPRLEEFYYVNTNEPTAHFRHARAAAGVAIDGQASAITTRCREARNADFRVERRPIASGGARVEIREDQG